MTVPVFLRFAALRESAGVTITDAANDLGIAVGWLHELEDFVRVPDTSFRVKPCKGFGSISLYARIAEVSRAYELSAGCSEAPWVSTLPADADVIKTILYADALFHSCISYLANVFLDFRPGGTGYQAFFNTFIGHLLCRDQVHPAVIHALHHPTTAHALDYALRRVWGATRKKRKSGRLGPGIYYQSTGIVEPGQPLGTLEGADAWRRAFWSVDAYPDRKPYFAYLILYICLKKMMVSFERPYSYREWPGEWCYKIFDQPPAEAPPAGAAMVFDTAFGEVTVFFRTLFEPNNDFYLVRGDAIL